MAGSWPNDNTRVEVVSLDPANHPVPECHKRKAPLLKGGGHAAAAGVDGGEAQKPFILPVTKLRVLADRIKAARVRRQAPQGVPGA